MQYALILVKILIFKLVVIILAFTMSHTTLMGYINIPISEYATDPEIRTEIDALQNGVSYIGILSAT